MEQHSESANWHILKGESQLGPYSSNEIIQMMQNKSIYGFDYIWAPHLENWTLLAETHEFSNHQILNIFNKMQQNNYENNNNSQKTSKKEIFFKRKFERVDCNLPVYTHDNQNLWYGTVLTLSEGGAMIRMNNPLLIPGDKLLLHFRENKFGLAPFNTEIEILSKKLFKEKINHDTALEYTVQFLNITEAKQNLIHEFIENLKKQ